MSEVAGGAAGLAQGRGHDLGRDPGHDLVRDPGHDLVNGRVRELVLVPGWAMPAAVFAPLLPLLAARWRVTVLPLPVADTLPAMADALLAAAPPRAAWLGWSLGGMVATQAACVQPARVSALLNVAAGLRFTTTDDWPAAMPATEFAAFAAAFAAAPDATLARFHALVTRGAATARADLRLLRTLVAGAGSTGLAGMPGHAAPGIMPAPADDGVAALARTLAVLGSADLRTAAGALACPQAWLFGEHDALLPASAAGVVQCCLPAAAVTVLPGASHTPFLSSSAAVVAALECLIPESP